MKKRLMSLLLTAAMVMSMIVVPASAEDAPIKLSVNTSPASAQPGEIVDVAISLEDVEDERMYTALEFKLSFDPEVLAPVNQASRPPKQYAVLGAWAGQDASFGQNFPSGTNYISVAIGHGYGVTGTGDIITMKFEVLQDVSKTESALDLDVTYAAYAVYDDDFNLLDTVDIVKNGELNVTDGSVGVIFPVTASTSGAEQTTLTTATLNGSYVKNVDTAEITEVGFVYDTEKEGAYASSIKADAVAEEFSATLTGETGKTYYFKSYVVADGVTYYSAGPDAIDMAPAYANEVTISGDDDIKVTKEPNTAAYTAAVTDQFGQAFEAAVKWSIATDLAGVSIDETTGVVTVTKEALASGTATITAKVDEDTFATKDITITRDPAQVAAIEISEIAETTIPAKAEEPVKVTLEAKGEDQYGDIVPVDATWSINNVTGVSIEGNVISIDYTAKTGEVEITANYNGVSDTAVLNIKRAESVATEVVMPEDATMTIPTNDTPNTKSFDAVVYDQYGDVMDAEVVYTFATADEFVTAADNAITVKKGAEKNKTYTLTAEYNGKTDSMEIKVVDIEITWGSITTNEATYGKTWGQIVNVTPGTAKLEGQDVPGTWTVADADVIPDAGEQTYTVVFKSNDGNYTVTTTGTATIAQAPIAATWAGYTGLVYNGEKQNVTASVAVEGVNVTITGGDAIDAGDYTATAALDNANYVLTNPEQAYSIAKADLPTFEGAAAQQLCIRKATNENLINQIKDEVKGYDFGDNVVTGTITIERNISELAIGSVVIEAVFAPDSNNFNNRTFQFELEITEGDPQTLVFANDSLPLTYGDADVTNAATVTVGTANPVITYASDNEAVASVDENGKITVGKVGSAIITATVAADGDWAASSASYTIVVSRKILTVDPATIGAISKVYDGSNVIDDAEAIAAIMANAQLVGVIGEDDVALDLTDAYVAFETTNAGENIPATIDSIVLKGAAAENYTIDAIEGLTGIITKATEVAVALSNTNQTPNNVTAVVVTITPFVDPANITVSYQVIDTPAVKAGDVLTPCAHDTDKTGCTAAEGAACDHTDGCGYTVATEDKEATYKWVTEVPQDAGTYPIQVEIKGDANVADATIATEDMKLVVASYSGGGGGGSSTPTFSSTVEKTENGSISLSAKRAAAGKEVTINVKPDKGYELKSVTIIDAEGNKIDVVEKDGKLTFVMPESKITVAAEFVEIGKVCPSEKFTDLAADTWYHDAVDFVIEQGMMSGVSADKFAPDMNLTRGMIVQILWAMEGKPVVNYAMSFEDVAADAWYAEAVRWAAAEGVATGYSAEKFGPNDSVTREQLAVMLYGYARNNDMDLSVGENTNILSYNDALSISDWAVSAMQWACGEGLISGTPDGDLMPTAVATRAQVAVILNNFYNLING